MRYFTVTAAAIAAILTLSDRVSAQGAHMLEIDGGGVNVFNTDLARGRTTFRYMAGHEKLPLINWGGVVGYEGGSDLKAWWWGPGAQVLIPIPFIPGFLIRGNMNVIVTARETDKWIPHEVGFDGAFGPAYFWDMGKGNAKIMFSANFVGQNGGSSWDEINPVRYHASSAGVTLAVAIWTPQDTPWSFWF